jgi:hypothetical protein
LCASGNGSSGFDEIGVFTRQKPFTLTRRLCPGHLRRNVLIYTISLSGKCSSTVSSIVGVFISFFIKSLWEAVSGAEEGAGGAPVGNSNAQKQSAHNEHFVLSKTADRVSSEYGVGPAV